MLDDGAAFYERRVRPTVISQSFDVFCASGSTLLGARRMLVSRRAQAPDVLALRALRPTGISQSPRDSALWFKAFASCQLIVLNGDIAQQTCPSAFRRVSLARAVRPQTGDTCAGEVSDHFGGVVATYCVYKVARRQGPRISHSSLQIGNLPLADCRIH